MTWGADPEMFVMASNKIIPICGLVGGTKGKANPIFAGYNDNIKHITALEDNVALELNFPVQGTPDNFLKMVHNAAEQVCSRGIPTIKEIPSEYLSLFTEETMEKYLLDSGMKLPPTGGTKRVAVIKDSMKSYNNLIGGGTGKRALAVSQVSSYEFSPGVFDKFPELKTIGCDPDFSAYGQRTPPTAEALGNWRHAAGHIHIGLNPWPSDLPKDAFVKFLDLFLACPMQMYDRQGPRRQHYGLAGLFRPKDYGIEYRTLSNKWIFSGMVPGGAFGTISKNLNIIHNLFSNYDIYQNDLIKLYNHIEWEEVKKAIDKEDARQCRGFYDIAVKAVRADTQNPGEM